MVQQWAPLAKELLAPLPALLLPLLAVEQTPPVATGLVQLVVVLPPLLLTARLAAVTALADLHLMMQLMVVVSFPRPVGHLLHQVGLTLVFYSACF